MLHHPQTEYYADRAMAERRMLASASDPRAAAAHAELVARYEALASYPSLDLPNNRSASG